MTMQVLNLFLEMYVNPHFSQKKREELCTNARMIFAKIVEKYGFSSRQRERLPTQMIPLRPSEDQTTLLCDLMRGEFS